MKRLKLKPGDPDAAGLLKAAEQGRASAGDAAKIEAEAKKKAEAHEKLVGEGKQALAAKQYDAAVKSFQKALDVLPADTATLALLKDAERLRKEQADLATKQQDDAVARPRSRSWSSRPRTALAAKNLDGADKAIDALVKLVPKAPDVLRLQQDLQTALDSERGAAEAKKRQAAFDKLLTTATAGVRGQALRRRTASAGGRRTSSIPADKEAAALRQDVLKAKSDLTAGDAKKKTEFAAQVNKAKQALTAKRFDEALLALNDADKLIPGDKEVLSLKQSAAEKGKADWRPPRTEAQGKARRASRRRS